MTGSSTIGSSRGWEIDEEDEIEIEKKSYVVNGSIPKSNLLVIATCQFSKAFTEVYIQGKNATEIGDLTELNEKTEEKRKVLKFHNPSTGLVVCTVTDKDVDLDFASDVSQKILGCTSQRSTEVIILRSEALSTLQSATSNGSNSIVQRQLTNEAFKSETKVERLEQPNTVSGLPAALLTLCEFEETPAILLLAYSGSRRPDRESISGFSGFFDLEQVRKVKDVIPRGDAEEGLKRLERRADDNLYL